MTAFRLKPFLQLLALAAFFVAGASYAAEKIPPAPARYFNDYVPLVSAATANALNAQLEANERATSNQLLVVIYPKMETDSSVEDYTVRIAQSWKVGQANKDNGAVLFVFMAQRQVYIQVGYGLEAVLTDAIAKRIVENEIVPRFRSGDVEGGLRAAVAAMIAATKGEYQGTGRTVADKNGGKNSGGFPVAVFIVIGIMMIVFGQIMRGANRNIVFGSPRYNRRRSGGWWMGPPGGGGGWSGGSSGGSSGGGFSGGGGSFGGGGAGGKW